MIARLAPHNARLALVVSGLILTAVLVWRFAVDSYDGDDQGDRPCLASKIGLPCQ